MRLTEQLSRRTAQRLGATYVFRPTTAYLVGVLWAAVSAVWVGMAARDGSLLGQLPPVTFVAAMVYATCVRPLVAVGDDGVLLRNVLRDVIVPWPELVGIGTQYALTLRTADGGKHTAWAAPAASRFATARATPADLRSVQWDDDSAAPPASASIRSDSGAAAGAVRAGWARARERAMPRGSVVAVRWAVPMVALLTISAALTVVSISWG